MVIKMCGQPPDSHTKELSNIEAEKLLGLTINKERYKIYNEFGSPSMIKDTKTNNLLIDIVEIIKKLNKLDKIEEFLNNLKKNSQHITKIKIYKELFEDE